MKRAFRLTLAVLLAATLASCNSGDKYVVKLSYLPVQLKGSSKWSIVELESGKIVAKDAFANSPSAVIDDMFFVADSTGRFNYYNIKDVSKPVNSEPFGSVTYFNEGRAIASHPGKALEVIDKDCKVVKQLSENITAATMFTHGMAVVHNDRNEFGYVTTSGDTAFAVNYAFAAAFLNDDVALVANATDSAANYTVIDKHGKELATINSAEYRVIVPHYSDGVLPVHRLKGDTLVCVDKHGKEVANPNAAPQVIKNAHYDDGSLTSGGYYIARTGNRVGLVDKKNQVRIPLKYDLVYDLTPNRYVVRLDSVYSLVDENGKSVGNLQFSDFVPVNTDHGAVRGYVDRAQVAAALLALVSDKQVAGAQAGATLMDVNGLVGTDPEKYVNVEAVPRQMGPLTIIYGFDRKLARIDSTDTSNPTPQFNLDAKLANVLITYDVHECKPEVEEQLLEMLTKTLGTKGFVLSDNGMFRSDDGAVLSLGYSKGVVAMQHFASADIAEPLPRVKRQR